jgi:N-acetylglucosaminyl-diphospho-decaprenol L-rhamnosyltransferase
MFLTKMVGLTAIFPNRFPEQRLTFEELNGSGIVDQVIGAYFLTRRSLFEKLDGFDERFFVYMEDVDFAYRAKQHSYASYFIADLAVDHQENVSSDQVRGRRLFYLLRSRTEYAAKHWPPWQPVLLAVFILTVEIPARLTVAAVGGRRAELGEIGEAARLYARYAATRVSTARFLKGG